MPENTPEQPLPVFVHMAGQYQPDTLPPGVTVPVALIANTPPRKLAEATGEIRSEFINATHGINVAEIIADQEYIKALKDNKKRRLDTIGATLGIPEEALKQADTVEEFFALLNPEDAPPEDPKLAAAKKGLEATRAAYNRAKARSVALDEPNDLAIETIRETRRLARRGRWASTIGGALLGGAAFLGLLNTHSAQEDLNPAPGTETTVTLETTQKALGILAAGSVVSFGAAGFGIGSLLKGRFAQRRARQIVKKAQDAASSSQ